MSELVLERVEPAAAHLSFVGELSGAAHGWAQRLLSPENPQRAHGDIGAFLTRQRDAASGRIIAWTDDRVPGTGFIGFFESEDFGSAKMLLSAATSWCRDQGCATVQGPFQFWPICGAGVPLESPAAGHVTRSLDHAGFAAREDLFTWRFADRPAPPPLAGLARATLTDPAITFTEFDRDRDEHWSLAHELYNVCYQGRGVFYPVEQAELELMASDFVAPELSFIAFVRGTPAGISLCLNSIEDTVALGNHVLPRALGNLLRPKRERTFRQWLYGVAPPFRGAALGNLSAALFMRLLTRAKNAQFAWGVGGPTPASSEKLSSTLRAVGAHQHSATRVYELRL